MSEMIQRLRSTAAPRTSWIDRAWSNKWAVLALTPVQRPEADDLRARIAEFMAADPTNPINCVLSADGSRWCPVDRTRRREFVERVVVATERMDAASPYPYIRKYAPAPDDTAPYKVLVGPDSLTCYVSHVLGDAVVVSSFGVLLALGDVDGLRYLRPNCGMGTASGLLATEFKSHYKDWWRHFRSGTARGAIVGLPSTPVPRLVTTDAVGVRLGPADLQRFQTWGKRAFPGISTSALVASAAYRALARNGVIVDPAGFYTLIDLRRYLRGTQGLRPGNLAKSVYIPADMVDPVDVSAGIREAIDSARAVPALAIGGLKAALRPVERSVINITKIDKITMTFNFMMRIQGVDHIPWKDPSAARFVAMAYPSSPDNLSVFACGVGGGIEFAVNFSPEVVDRSAVQRALEELNDMPGLLSAAPVAATTIR
jgi:hypothetical protein